MESPRENDPNKVGEEQSLNDIGWTQPISKKDAFTGFPFA
jgi:hypothetical protein